MVEPIVPVEDAFHNRRRQFSFVPTVCPVDGPGYGRNVVQRTDNKALSAVIFGDWLALKRVSVITVYVGTWRI